MSEQLAVSVPEAAKRIGVSRNLAFQMAQRGELPSVRVGRRRIVPLAALNRWLEEQAGEASAR